MLNLILVFISFVLSLSAHALQGKEGEFSGVNGIKIRYLAYVNPKETKGAIVYVNGFRDAYLKNLEYAKDMYEKGYSFYHYDHRGQGLSERILKDSQAGYVDEFRHYIQDLKTLVDTVVKPKRHKALYVQGYSMGGAIAALYLGEYPGDFKAAALVSPALEVNTGYYPYWFAQLLSWINIAIGRDDEYAPGEYDWRPGRPFEQNTLTHSPERYAGILRVDEEHPAVRLGGATYRTVFEMLKSASLIQSTAGTLKTPVLVLQAGLDTRVLPDGQNRFCSKAPHCTLVKFPDAYHDIIKEVDPIRDQAIQTITDFFAKQR